MKKMTLAQMELVNGGDKKETTKKGEKKTRNVKNMLFVLVLA